MGNDGQERELESKHKPECSVLLAEDSGKKSQLQGTSSQGFAAGSPLSSEVSIL